MTRTIPSPVPSEAVTYADVEDICPNKNRFIPLRLDANKWGHQWGRAI